MISKSEFNEKKSQGWFYCRIILQIVGKPKEHVETTLSEYIKKIEESKEYLLYTKNINVAEKLQTEEGIKDVGQLYSSFGEMEILFKTVIDIINFSFEYMPSSIEIIEPTTLVLKNIHLNGFINDLLRKLHNLNYIVKNNEQDKQQLLNNQNIILRNLMIVALTGGPKNIETLGQLSGLPSDFVKPIISNLVKENLVEKYDEKYRLKR